MTTGAKRPRGPKDTERMRRRRDAILDQAAPVFARRGYRQMDVQELADRVGVAKGTVYNYFASKEMLFLDTVDRVMRRLQGAVREAADAETDALERIAAAVRAHLAFFDRHPEFVELLILERAEFKDRRAPTYFRYKEANEDRWRRLAEQLIRDGRLRRVPVDRVLDVISDLLYGAIFTNAFAGRDKSFEQQAEDVLDVVWHGILPAGESAG
jgi:AcrR family transcriptional regulator